MANFPESVLPVRTRPNKTSLTIGASVAIGEFLQGDPSTGAIEPAEFNSLTFVGYNSTGQALSSGDVRNIDIEGPLDNITVDSAVLAGQRLKVSTSTSLIRCVDSNAAATIIKASTGGNFGNQPANDGVEFVSDDASDDMDLTIYYTRNGQGDTVFQETKAVNGTTQVALTHTDVALVLGAELSALGAGTITIREASANATITTIDSTATLVAGIVEVDSANQDAFNAAPTAVAGGASTKQIGLIGVDESGAALLDSQALNGTTAVAFNDTFRLVTRLLVGDVASATTATVAVGAEDDENMIVAKALENISRGSAGKVRLL